MKIIPRPDIVESYAVITARDLLTKVDSMGEVRVTDHIKNYTQFWDNLYATPDEILIAMGTSALIWLLLAAESADHLARIHAIRVRFDPSLADAPLLEEAQWKPRRAFIIEMDGGVPTGRLSLAPPTEGYDLHGKPIVDTTPEP